MDESDVPTWLTTTEITAPVRRQLGDDGVSIGDWTCERLAGGAGECIGVWRVSGSAATDNALQPWSLILKGWVTAAPNTVASAWNWPNREMEMYRSGLLADLPGGITAPTCFEETERPDGSVWLWFEEIADNSEGPWPLGCYAAVARHLGQFNGAYLAERPLPKDPCTSHSWLRGWVEAAAPAVAELATVSDHALVRQVYPPHIIDAYTRLWADRHKHYEVLDRLPQAFCHLDAFRRNLFFRQGPDGTDETILIDWAYAGTAGVGEELAPLAAGSVSFMEVPIENARHLEEMVLESYIEGLREAGWGGSPDLVRTGYGIAAALRYGVGALRLVLPTMLDEQHHPYVQQLFGTSMSEIGVHWGGVNEWLADLVPER